VFSRTLPVPLYCPALYTPPFYHCCCLLGYCYIACTIPLPAVHSFSLLCYAFTCSRCRVPSACASVPVLLFLVPRVGLVALRRTRSLGSAATPVHLFVWWFLTALLVVPLGYLPFGPHTKLTLYLYFVPSVRCILRLGMRVFTHALPCPHVHLHFAIAICPYVLFLPYICRGARCRCCSGSTDLCYSGSGSPLVDLLATLHATASTCAYAYCRFYLFRFHLVGCLWVLYGWVLRILRCSCLFLLLRRICA